MSAYLPVKGGFRTLVDDDVAARFSDVKLRMLFPKRSAPLGYVVFKGRRPDGEPTTTVLHRRVMQMDGLSPLLLVDHINGDTLDNRRVNLRVVTTTRSAWNTRGQRRNKSGYKGVSRDKNGRFRATISTAGKQRYLGCFATAEEAARAYDAAAFAERGENTCLNFAPGIRGVPLAREKP